MHTSMRMIVCSDRLKAKAKEVAVASCLERGDWDTDLSTFERV